MQCYADHVQGRDAIILLGQCLLKASKMYNSGPPRSPGVVAGTALALPRRLRESASLSTPACSRPPVYECAHHLMTTCLITQANTVCRRLRCHDHRRHRQQEDRPAPGPGTDRQVQRIAVRFLHSGSRDGNVRSPPRQGLTTGFRASLG